jgi:membrane-bound metal-dependent hydrolase YbcI (DUF457 family)
MYRYRPFHTGNPDRLAHMLFSLMLCYIAGCRNPVDFLLAVAFATFPDLDLHLWHRELLHNIFVVLGIPLLFYLAGLPYLPVLIALGSHIILDIMSPSGVSVFFPLSKRRISLGLFRSGEQTLLFVLLILMLYLFYMYK